MTEAVEKGQWTEATSEEFLSHADDFVPMRAVQASTITRMIPEGSAPCHVAELCSGEGLLSRAILEAHPNATIHAYDGSAAMREATAKTLDPFAPRFTVEAFDIADREWRTFPWPLHAVVSSLAIHHLDAGGKKQLYGDMFDALAPGGALIVADVVLPASMEALANAAERYEEIVEAQSHERWGDDRGLRRFQEAEWNLFRDIDGDPVDKPSPVAEQLAWLGEIGFAGVDVFWMEAGHAIIGGRKPPVEMPPRLD